MNAFKEHSPSLKLALLALTTLGDMFSHSTIRIKMDGDDEKEFESLLAVWAKGLEVMTQADIERGLNAVLKSGMEYEPSLPSLSSCVNSRGAKPFITCHGIDLRRKRIRSGLDISVNDQAMSPDSFRVTCWRRRLNASGSRRSRPIYHGGKLSNLLR